MKNSTDITIILDRSGSMSGIKNATIESFNFFLNEQRSNKFKTNLSLAQFDHEYQMIYEEININLAQDLTNKSFVPRGSTALFDAIGTTINLTKERIKNRNKKNKPSNVIIAIITDGLENSSSKYSRKKIFKKIAKREKNDKWNFVFLAANQDAIQEGLKFGINSDKALTYQPDDSGVRHAMRSLSMGVMDLMNPEIEEFKFSELDRKKQKR